MLNWIRRHFRQSRRIAELEYMDQWSSEKISALIRERNAARQQLKEVHKILSGEAIGYTDAVDKSLRVLDSEAS